MRNREEAQLSATLKEYLEAAKPRCIYAAVPNGGSRSMIEAVNLKRQGVIAGAGDWVFTWDFGSGWIELKTEKGMLNSNQEAFRDSCQRLGVKYEVARSLEECIAVLKSWNLLP
jgi:VRR-NUC domain